MIMNKLRQYKEKNQKAALRIERRESYLSEFEALMSISDNDLRRKNSNERNPVYEIANIQLREMMEKGRMKGISNEEFTSLYNQHYSLAGPISSEEQITQTVTDMLPVKTIPERTKESMKVLEGIGDKTAGIDCLKSIEDSLLGCSDEERARHLNFASELASSYPGSELRVLRYLSNFYAQGERDSKTISHLVGLNIEEDARIEALNPLVLANPITTRGGIITKDRVTGGGEQVYWQMQERGKTDGG